MKISVHPAECFRRYRTLWAALESVFDARFHGTDAPMPSDGQITFADCRQAAELRLPATGHRLIYLTSPPGSRLPEDPAPVHLRLADTPHLPPVFRGFSANYPAFGVSACRVASEFTPIAFRADEPFWFAAATGGTTLHVVGLDLPPACSTTPAADLLFGNHLPHLLPLFAFLALLPAGPRWQPAPMRAAFMMDDPNLHGRSYGYIRYQDLANHARINQYHAAMATVPLDGWLHSPAAASIFSHNPRQLSLLIHGNNHTRQELARPQTLPDARAIIHQAMERIARLEISSGVPISRVMAAPHGACNALSAQAMLEGGLEGACISRGSLRHWNPSTNWHPAFGLLPCEFLGGGFPVMPRYPLRKAGMWNYLCALALGQPLIIVGHHQDLAEGYDLMSEIAHELNRRANVHWTNLTDIARSNFWYYESEQTYRIRLFSRRVCIHLPQHIRSLHLENACAAPDAGDEFHVEFADGHREVLRSSPGEPSELRVSAPCACTISIIRRSNSQVTSKPPSTFWPILRRWLAEGRDRLQPLLRRPNLNTD